MINIDWEIDKESSKPIYRQIVEYFKAKINSGDWPVGLIIPTQRKLADMLSVNRSTIVTALEELKAEGILEGNGKAGTRIVDNTLVAIAKLQPKWQSYIEEGIHIPNLNTIKQINKLDFDKSIIRLSSGEASPDLLPENTMSTILKEVSKDIPNLGYEEPKGMLYLREQISKYLKKYGIDASPNSILIVSGALQAVQLVTMGLMQPGATVFLEKPSYLYSLQTFQSMGLRRSGLPMDKEGIRADLISKDKRKHGLSILYTIPSFQNPTGIVMSENRRKQLIEVCQTEKLPIIEDDVYRELWLDAPTPNPIKSFDKNGLVLYVGSVSKTLSPGLRIGWIVGPEPVIERLSDIKMQTDYGSSSLSQLAVAKWLETGLYQENLEYLRKQLYTRREVAVSALQKYFSDIASFDIPLGGYFMWLEIKYPINMYKLFEEACKIGILINPGHIYDINLNQHLRISYSFASIKDLQKGIYELSKLTRKLILEKS